ncbi:MAG TPA: heparinase II/III family protein, partial [candidate division Zixibacteria bacterium]|nr:heparinase II/III family protein [candidate division Zixibacteria bacterium]
ESSSGYHLLTLEFYLFALTVCRQNNIALPLRYIRRLGKMASLTQELTAPHGRLINVGDNDSGRLFKLAPRADGDPRWLVLWTALEGLCANSCPRAVAQSAESVWLFGMKETPAIQEITSQSTKNKRGVSRYHRGAGQVIMRHDDLWLHVNVGQIGSGGIGGHKHNDDLALALVWGDRELITDPGMRCYTADPVERNRLRSITSHSTISLETEETNRFVPGYLFALRRDGHTQVNTWLSTTELDLLQATHNCYSRLPGGPRITRTVYFDKLARFWLIRDQAHPTSVSLKTTTQQLTAHLIVRQPGITVHDNVAILELVGAHGRRLAIRCFTSGASVSADPFALSPSYGTSRPGARLAMAAPKGETELIWGVFPNEFQQHKEFDTELLAQKFKLLEWPTIGLSRGVPHPQLRGRVE